MQQQEEKRLNCETHPESELLMIYIGDDPQIKERLFCIECVLQRDQHLKKQRLSQYIRIKDFFKNPGMTFRKIISDLIDAYIEESNILIQQLIIHLKKFQESVQIHLEQLKQNVKSFKIISSQINYEIEKQSNFNQLRKLFLTIKTMDSFQGTDEYKQFQEDLNAFSKNLPKFYKKAVDQIKPRYTQLIKDYEQSILNIQKDLSQMSQVNIYPYFKIDDFNQENQSNLGFVLSKIRKGKSIKFDLLYQGTRDGLMLDKYWQKCDKQSHLLTIIKLKNGIIFGGYSPCQLDKAINYWIPDNTNSSFIFQQNNNEIYELKDNNYAIFCRSDYGPQFGGDFYIKYDFKKLVSSLGHSYDTTGYDIQNNRTHLIGEKDTEIVECKVYKIMFL